MLSEMKQIYIKNITAELEELASNSGMNPEQVKAFIYSEVYSIAYAVECRMDIELKERFEEVVKTTQVQEPEIISSDDKTEFISKIVKSDLISIAQDNKMTPDEIKSLLDVELSGITYLVENRLDNEIYELFDEVKEERCI